LATIAGLVLIWRTLRHTSDASTYAKQTVDVAKAQLRAALRIKSCNAKPQTSGGLNIEVTYENTGQSSAKLLKNKITFDVYERESDFPAALTPKDAADDTPIFLSQADAKSIRLTLRPLSQARQLKAISEGQHLYLNGIFTFVDIFGQEGFLKYAFSIKGPNAKGQMTIREMTHS